MMDKQTEIKRTLNASIAQLYGQAQYTAGKAKLAKLRNSIGKSDLVETYPFVFEWISEGLLGQGKYLSDEEKAIICTMQLYALLQQGKSECVHVQQETYQNVGTALARLRIQGDSEAIDRRFNSMILSDTEEEFLTHLRYILQIYKSKDMVGKLDFAQMGTDIFRYIHWEKGKEEIRLSWSREYYKSFNKGEDDNE